MSAGTHYLFDLPIYRLSEDDYYAQRDAHVDRIMTENPLANTPIKPSEAVRLDPQDAAFVSHLRHKYGGPWQFNEVVGYLRLPVLGSQVRAEHWLVCCKRVSKSRTKIIELRSLKFVPETELPSRGANPDIFAAVLRHIDACEKHLPRRFLDTSQLNLLGPHLDWRGLIGFPARSMVGRLPRPMGLPASGRFR